MHLLIPLSPKWKYYYFVCWNTIAGTSWLVLKAPLGIVLWSVQCLLAILYSIYTYHQEENPITLKANNFEFQLAYKAAPQRFYRAEIQGWQSFGWLGLLLSLRVTEKDTQELVWISKHSTTSQEYSYLHFSLLKECR